MPKVYRRREEMTCDVPGGPNLMTNNNTVDMNLAGDS